MIDAPVALSPPAYQRMEHSAGKSARLLKGERQIEAKWLVMSTCLSWPAGRFRSTEVELRGRGSVEVVHRIEGCGVWGVGCQPYLVVIRDGFRCAINSEVESCDYVM